MSKQLRKVICKRRFYLRFFVVSVVLMLIACFLTKFFGNAMYNMNSYFFNLTHKEYEMFVFGCMSIWKLLIVQFTLAPLLALYWLQKYHELNDDTDVDYDNRRY